MLKKRLIEDDRDAAILKDQRVLNIIVFKHHKAKLLDDLKAQELFIELAESLLSNPRILSEASTGLNTGLHVAAEFNLEMTRVMIEAGIDPNLTNVVGETALDVAGTFTSDDEKGRIVEYLRAHGGVALESGPNVLPPLGQGK